MLSCLSSRSTQFVQADPKNRLGVPKVRCSMPVAGLLVIIASQLPDSNEQGPYTLTNICILAMLVIIRESCASNTAFRKRTLLMDWVNAVTERGQCYFSIGSTVVIRHEYGKELHPKVAENYEFSFYMNTFHALFLSRLANKHL